MQSGNHAAEFQGLVHEACFARTCNLFSMNPIRCRQPSVYSDDATLPKNLLLNQLETYLPQTVSPTMSFTPFSAVWRCWGPFCTRGTSKMNTKHDFVPCHCRWNTQTEPRNTIIVRLPWQPRSGPAELLSVWYALPCSVYQPPQITKAAKMLCPLNDAIVIPEPAGSQSQLGVPLCSLLTDNFEDFTKRSEAEVRQTMFW